VKAWISALVLGALLVLTAPVSAKPVGPLCFTEAVYGAHWVIDSSQVGTHWVAVGHVDWNGFRYPVNGSGSGAVLEVYTSLGGNAVWAFVNLNSEAAPIPAPNTANVHFYIWYSVWDPEEGYYAVHYLSPPLFSYLTTASCS
jgi:hypothetical protein